MLKQKRLGSTFNSGMFRAEFSRLLHFTKLFIGSCKKAQN